MKDTLNSLIPVVGEVSDLLRKHFLDQHYTGPGATYSSEEAKSVEFKESHELVLGVDLLSQKILIDQISSLFPEYSIYSEETDNWSEFLDDTKFRFVIDPIDGTHNFHFGLPTWGIALSLLDPSCHPIAGLISIPMMDLIVYNFGDKTYYIKNGEESEAVSSKRTSISQSLISYDNQFYKLEDSAMRIYEKMTSIALTTRISGSAAFDAVMIALGKLDARIWNSVEIYDIAAAFSIVRGAGGIICDFKGEEKVGVNGGAILACSNHSIKSQILDGIALYA